MANIILRCALEEDMENIYIWRNAAETRKFSFNATPIPWETHVQWFRNSIARTDRFILIAELDKSPIGVLRYDRLNGDEAKVDIYLIPGLYGRGLGTTLLKCGIEWAKENMKIKAINAEIIADNIGSLNAFTKAGFTEAYRVYKYTY